MECLMQLNLLILVGKARNLPLARVITKSYNLIGS
jgi:hypothetical protein